MYFFSECGISGELILETPQWEETQPNNWPWTVHFVASFSWISMPIDGCLGVILSKNLIITAAHCFSGLESTHVKVITNAGETLKVKRIIKHHSFDLKSGKADIALIKLAKTLNFSLKVRPICLPKKTDLMKALRDNSKTLGMVLLRDESKLKKKTVRIGTAKHCTKKKFFHGGMICAGSKQDECTGDSGAPLMFTMWRRDKQHIKYLGGILSWGRDQFEEECDSELSYVAYNSLQRYLGWILHHIGRN